MSGQAEVVLGDVEHHLAVASDAARAGGAELVSWAGRFSVREKGRADLVTDADHASQAAVVAVLDAAFPEYAFLGEEGLSREGASPGAPRWVIDPLDGTSNYVHGFPYYGVSIGLVVDAEPVLGVVYDPCRDELFAAGPGVGATCNGGPISVSGCEAVASSLLVASLPRNTDPEDVAVRRFLTALPLAESVQRTGSAALNLCYVAAGRLDGFWSTSLKPWDQAGGVPLVTEAGGSVSTVAGGLFSVTEPDLLVTNGTAMHGELVEILRLSRSA
ncbi:MAG: inositol monophosphatase family protein [Planctomycetota bacterium]